MATAEQYAEWIVNNADKKGTPEFETVAEAYKAAKQQTATKPLGMGERFGMGLMDPVQGGAQLLTKMLPEGVVKAGNQLNNWLADSTGLVGRLPEGGVDQQTREREASYQQRRQAAGQDGVDWLRLAGNVVNPVNLAAGGMGAGATTMAGKIAAGGALGGATSALQPVTEGDDFAADKAKQMGLGTLAGGAAPMVAAGLGRIISPKASVNPDVQMLRQAGVQPTIGQTLGGRMNALEEKATSLPIMGDAISVARQRSLDQFNRAAINRAVEPIGGKVDEVGQAGVSKAGDALSDAYETAKKAVKSVKFDQQFAQDFGQLRQMSRSLTPPMRQRFDTEVKNVFGSRLSPAKAMLGDTFKKVDSELGQKAAKFSGSSVASEQELGDALKQMQALLRDQAMRSNPQAAKLMREADEGWANLVRVEGAATRAKNADGVFTPGQLNMAVQSADRSVRKRAVARGDALMQDLASAGQNVIGNKVPNSFTTDRALVAGGGLGAYFVDPLIPAGLVSGAAAYTPWVQSLLRGSVAARPSLAQPVAGMLNDASPMLGPAAGLFALEVAK